MWPTYKLLPLLANAWTYCWISSFTFDLAFTLDFLVSVQYTHIPIHTHWKSYSFQHFNPSFSPFWSWKNLIVMQFQSRQWGIKSTVLILCRNLTKANIMIQQSNFKIKWLSTKVCLFNHEILFIVKWFEIRKIHNLSNCLMSVSLLFLFWQISTHR